MKHIFYFCMSLFMILCGCSNEEVINEVDNNEYVNVKIGVCGDVLEITQEPMTKSLTSDDLTWIQVFRTYGDGYYPSDPYAYGLFDNVEEISILLNRNDKYKIIAKTIINGKNRVYNEDGVYEIGDPYKQKITNSFQYSEDVDLSFIYFSSVRLEDGKSYYMPDIDSYFGEILNFNVMESNSCLLDMKRQTCSIKICTKGLEEGCRLKAIFGGHEKYITSDDEPYENLFSVPNDGAVNENTFFEFILEKDGAEKIIDKRNIAIEINKRTSIIVNIPKEDEETITDSKLKLSITNTPIEDGPEVVI